MKFVIPIAILLSASWGKTVAFNGNEVNKTGVVKLGAEYVLLVTNGVVDLEVGLYQSTGSLDKYSRVNITGIRNGALDFGDGRHLYITNGALDIRAGLQISRYAKDVRSKRGIFEFVNSEDGLIKRELPVGFDDFASYEVIETGVVGIGDGAYLTIENGVVEFTAGLYKHLLGDPEGGIYYVIKHVAFDVPLVKEWDSLWKLFVDLETRHLKSYGKTATDELEDVYDQLKHKIHLFSNNVTESRSPYFEYIKQTIKSYVAIPEYYVNLNKHLKKTGNMKDYDDAKSMQTHLDVYLKVIAAASED